MEEVTEVDISDSPQSLQPEMHQQESQPAPPTLFDATVSDTAQTPTHFSVSVTERKTSIPVSSQATPALQDSGYDSPYAFASPFHVSVAAPEKVGDNIINSHVVYAIQVKTSLPQYRSSSFTAQRRYSDFVWLREQLAEHNKGYLIPPLPEKAILNRFNVEFMEYRRRELEKFLVRVVHHPVLALHKTLQIWLEAESSEAFKTKEELSTAASSTSAPSSSSGSSTSSGSSSGRGFLSFLGSTVESISHTLQTSAGSGSGSGGSGSQHSGEPDQWFDAKKNYINALEIHLNSLLKAINSMIKKRKELSQSFSEFGIASSLLCSSESDHDEWMANSFNSLADISRQIVVLDEKRIDDETAFYEDAIRDYIRLCGAVKEMLECRTEKLHAYQHNTRQLESKKEKLEKSKTPQPKLEKEIEEFERKVSESRQEFQNISEIVKGELQKFETQKAKDFKKIFEKFSQINITYELQAADQWKIFLKQMS